MNENERSALAAYRDALERKEPDAQRAWERLVEKIDAGAQPLSIDLEPPRRRPWLAWGLGAAAAVLLAVWAWPRGRAVEARDAGAGSEAVFEAERPRGQPVVAPSQPPTPAVSPKPETLNPPEVAAPLDPVTPAAVPKDKPVRSTKARPAAPGGHDVVAEAGAIRGVRAALRDGEARRALRLLRRYRSRFPQGQFADEAAVLRADALCLDGRAAKAQAAAQAFVRDHPTSPLAARAKGICAHD